MLCDDELVLPNELLCSLIYHKSIEIMTEENHDDEDDCDDDGNVCCFVYATVGTNKEIG